MKLDKNQNSFYQTVPKGHWLSNKRNCEHFFEWNTYYRKNLHRFAADYLGLNLHLYQSICLYLMNVSTLIVIIAARAAAKSFLLAIFACCRCILYPGSKIVLTSGTRGQSKLIVSEKIQNELMDLSPMLCREIDSIVVNQSEVIVKFRNGSTIETVTCSPTARGHRSTAVCGEEAREINKTIFDTIISPFQMIRQAPFMTKPDYVDKVVFQEEPIKIYISSSFQESHWLYKTSKSAMDGAFKGNGSFFLAMDYAITMRHGIRSRKQLLTERKEVDELTWQQEYENYVIRTNSKAYFTYDMVRENQVMKRAFYPRVTDDVRTRTKNRFAIPKLPGEIRIVSCDIAMVDRSGNDNSVYSCLRLFTETMTTQDGHRTQEYKVQVPYLEGLRGTEGRKQAIRIRQLYDDFDADYIVLDVRGVGVSVYDALARVLYDDDRACEYKPFKAMNDDEFAQRIVTPGAEPNIYCISANVRMNSEMVVNLRSLFTEHRIELLIPKDEGIDEIKRTIPEYLRTRDPDVMHRYEKPYLETMLLVNELIKLEYEKLENTGLIRVHEQSGMMKDRYSSLAMGCLFASKLSRDLYNTEEEIDFCEVAPCVSQLTFGEVSGNRYRRRRF